MDEEESCSLLFPRYHRRKAQTQHSSNGGGCWAWSQTRVSMGSQRLPRPRRGTAPSAASPTRRRCPALVVSPKWRRTRRGAGPGRAPPRLAVSARWRRRRSGPVGRRRAGRGGGGQGFHSGGRRCHAGALPGWRPPLLGQQSGEVALREEADGGPGRREKRKASKGRGAGGHCAPPRGRGSDPSIPGALCGGKRRVRPLQ